MPISLNCHTVTPHAGTALLYIYKLFNNISFRFIIKIKYYNATICVQVHTNISSYFKSYILSKTDY